MISSTAAVTENPHACRLTRDFELLRHSALFSGLHLDVVKLFAYLSSRRTYQPGDLLIEQGEKADKAFIISQGEAELLIPAPIETAIASKIRDMAIEAFLAVDCAGLARVDFFYVEKTGEILINEINTLPGFTALSMYPQLWAATGIPFPELVDRLIELALERKKEAAEEKSP